MTARLVLPLPPSVNRSHRNVTVQKRIRTPETVAYMRDAGWLAKAWAQQTHWCIPPPQKKVVMRVWYWWPNARRQDTHNRIKVLADALEGVLYEDDRCVLVQEQDYAVDRERPRVEIELEVSEDG